MHTWRKIDYTLIQNMWVVCAKYPLDEKKGLLIKKKVLEVADGFSSWVKCLNTK